MGNQDEILEVAFILVRHQKIYPLQFSKAVADFDNCRILKFVRNRGSHTLAM